MRFLYLAIILSACVIRTANAFELATHGKLTYEAYQRSSLLIDVDLLNKLGLEESANPSQWKLQTLMRKAPQRQSGHRLTIS
jgi:hypothetical protein